MLLQVNFEDIYGKERNFYFIEAIVFRGHFIQQLSINPNVPSLLKLTVGF